MLRIKLPAGRVTPEQLKAVGELSLEYGKGSGELSTRQTIQVHYLELASLPEVFPDFAPGSFSWDDDLNGWVWTTFNTWQWDLNWHNPDVFAELTDLVLDLAAVMTPSVPSLPMKRSTASMPGAT